MNTLLVDSEPTSVSAREQHKQHKHDSHYAVDFFSSFI